MPARVSPMKKKGPRVHPPSPSASASDSDSDHYTPRARLLPDRPRARTRRRVTAGVVLAAVVLGCGLLSTLALETLRVLLKDPTLRLRLQPSLGAGPSPPAPDFCPMPPDFSPTDDEVFGALRAFPKFDLTVPMVRKYSRLIHSYLEPWAAIQGAAQGLGSSGMVAASALQGIAAMPSVMSCGGHIKLAQGRVFFRYGGFWHVYYRLHRFLQSVKMIQDAVEQYGLTELQLELFLNTCDHPQSFYSAHWADRPGFPIMSTGFTADTRDIPIPDPLDLTPDYTPDLSLQIPWEKKVARGVFRGKTTNFQLADGNWGANPRVRLHLMSDTGECRSLMDAHINCWSHASADAQKQMARDGIHLAKRMNFTQFNAFKYQVIVDGGGGSCRTCGVLRSNQMSFRQRTPLLQFYEPLAQDNTHWLLVQRTFDDLPERIRWCQKNDGAALKVVGAANELAAFACTLRGRTLYWALLLVKYQQAMMQRDKVAIPPRLCPDQPTLKSPANATNPALVKCDDPDVDKKQVGTCMWFCATGLIPEEKFVWLRADIHLKNFTRVGPP